MRTAPPAQLQAGGDITEIRAGSVMEFIKVIDPAVDPVNYSGEASDAVELVIPSLPGYGWSGKPAVTGWSVEKDRPGVDRADGPARL